MPRTTGTYAAPANSVNPAVAGTNIDPSDFNALVDDLETALTESVYTSGLGATDNRLVRTDGTDTKKLQSTGITVDDSNNMNGVTSITLAGGGALRDVLSANRTYYVRKDGSDSNNGLADTAGGAFLTIQAAVNAAMAVDPSIYTVTVQIGDGTYSEGVTVGQMLGNSRLTIQGNSSTPSNVVVSATSKNAFAISLAAARIKDLKVETTTSGSGIVVTADANIFMSNIVFGAIATHGLLATRGGVIVCNGNWSITGNSINHIYCGPGGYIETYGRTVTLTGTPAFTAAFVYVDKGHFEGGAMTFSGSATGQRYSVNLNGTIQTNGGGATYFPGDVAGGAATGGQYA